MMTAEQLKASILQLAMEGKLVEQSPEEGTGEELYQKIQAEKATLVKEGKITKQKSLPEITDDEKPFDIPESWRWTYIGEIFDHNTGKALNGSNSAGKVLSYITTSNLYWNRFELDKLKRMPFTDSEIEKCTIHKGDLLVCEGGDYGRAAIWPFDYDMRIQNHIHRLRPYVEVSVQFYYYLIRLYKLSGRIKGKGIGIQGLSSGALHKLYAPLPPLREQYHIVKKIEELMPFVNQYATVSEKLDKLNSEFPDQVKKSILQLAVEGKLVEQRPEEGTGEELFQKIQELKAKLIKEGKIKKQKPLADITDEEKPFDIPESWKWLRLDQIATVVTDGEHKTPRRVSKYCGYYLLSARNVLNGRIQLSDVDYVDEEEFLSISKRCNPVRGDVLISCSGTIGRCTIVDDDNAYVMVRSAAMVRALIVPEYLMYCLQSAFLQEQMRKNAKQTAQANLFQAAIRNLVLPVPPLEEQKRIVEKLHKVLPTVNKLK